MTKYVTHAVAASLIGVSTSTSQTVCHCTWTWFHQDPWWTKKIRHLRRYARQRRRVQTTCLSNLGHHFTGPTTNSETKGAISSKRESLPKNKKTILKDRSRASKKSTQATNFTQDSTTNGKDLRGFWNTYKAEQSKQLWLPTKTDLLVLQPKSSNGSSIKLVADSSFRAAITNAPNKSSLKILWQSSTFSLAGSMEKGEPRVAKREDLPRAVNRARHYKLALTYMSNMF